MRLTPRRALSNKDRQRILDVGAGFGKLLGELLERRYAVTAVTACVYQAEQIAAQYPGVRVECGLFQEVGWGFPAASFDVVLFAESFRYISELHHHVPPRSSLPAFQPAAQHRFRKNDHSTLRIEYGQNPHDFRNRFQTLIPLELPNRLALK